MMPRAKPDSFDEAIHPSFIQWSLEFRPDIPFDVFLLTALLPNGEHLFKEEDKVRSLVILIRVAYAH